MVTIYIPIFIIFIFKVHGNYSIPQAHHLNYDVIIRNHKHYLWLEFIIFKNSKCYLQKHFEAYAIILNITTHCPKTHHKYPWKPKNLLIIRVHEGWKLMATCVVTIHLVGLNMGWTQPSPA